MTTPHTPPAALPDVAAIEARAATAVYGIAAVARSGGINTVAVQHSAEAVAASAADVPTLLAELRSLRAHVASEPERTAAAVAGERERCEEMCRDLGDDYDPRCREREGAHACADAIAATGGR